MEETENTEADNLESKIDALVRKRQGFERNRNLVLLVFAFLVYSMYQAYANDAPEWWFWLLMGALLLADAAVFVYDCLNIKKLNKQKTALESDIQREQAATN